MIKLLVSNVNSISMSDITVIGFPDDSKSDSKRTGSKKGPKYDCTVYNDSQYFDAAEKKIPILPMAGNMNKKIYDYGNVCRDEHGTIWCLILVP